MKKVLGLVTLFIGVFLIAQLVRADMTDKATLGGQSTTNGVYDWRVTSTGDLVPGTTSQNNIGSASLQVNNVYAVNEILSGTSTNNGPVINNSTVQGPGTQGYDLYTIRQRIPIASVNTGVTILSAVSGRKYRVTNCEVIAYGAAVTSTTATGVKLIGTQSASAANLFVVAKAQLTESTLNQFGTASTTLLADGASTIQNDANTAITFSANGGSDLAGATGIDVILTYTIE